jgi:hypothetical protein
MYLRQIEPGKWRDPTMTYVPDLAAIEPGHWLRLPLWWVRIGELSPTSIFGVWNVSSGSIEVHPDDIPADAIIHDLREEAIETARYAMPRQNGQPPTREEARAMLSALSGPS